ncbi:Scavenger receptor class B member 1 [Halotydeus destructor]|nr:Scavenger receptor class B member 1 [Halotydeus destructor]
MAVNEGKLVVGLFLVILGGLTIILVPLGAKLFAQETQIKLDPESTLFKEAWNAQPFVQDVYLFNVTNPVQVEQFGAKPILRQVGPFCYQAVIRKANVVFHGKNRVAYNPVRQYRFCRECSKFDEDVLITTINIPLVTALQKFRDNDQLLQALIALIKVTGFETMFVTKTAKQLVFEGYRDTLVAGGNLLPDTEKYDNGQFAIYKNHNNTLGPRVVVYTGKHDIDKINTVIALDGRKQLKNWDHASCSSLDGAVEDYTVHPPVDDDEVKVMKLLFLPACRVFSYSLKDDDTIKKYGFTLDSKKFVFDKRNLFNGNDFHGNRCYDKSSKSLKSFYVQQKRSPRAALWCHRRVLLLSEQSYTVFTASLHICRQDLP